MKLLTSQCKCLDDPSLPFNIVPDTAIVLFASRPKTVGRCAVFGLRNSAELLFQNRASSGSGSMDEVHGAAKYGTMCDTFSV
jgi:hypothetical protein